MALIKCIECGKEISSKANVCPHCGCPVEDSITSLNDVELTDKKEEILELENEQTNNSSNDAACPEKKEQNQTKSNNFIFRLSVIVLSFFIIFGMIIVKFSNEENDANKKQEQQEEIAAIDIFQMDLINNWDDYVGKKVSIVGTYYNYNITDKLLEFDYFREYDQSSSDRIKCEINILNKDTYKDAEYIMIEGYVKNEHYKLANCKITKAGSKAKEIYDYEIEDYNVRLAEIEARNEEEFRNSDLESPTYEDLLRYPETYKTTKIKLEAYISEREVNGLLTEGTIWGTYQGNSIVVKDNRKTKEPEILTNDKLVIYGYGDGTTVKKTYKKGTGFLGTDLGAEVVSEETIPKISLLYCDFK